MGRHGDGLPGPLKKTEITNIDTKITKKRHFLVGRYENYVACESQMQRELTIIPLVAT